MADTNASTDRADGSRASSSMGRRIRGLDATERREQRRGQLLDAALELFASNGYMNSSIEQICQTAYVGTKSFYEVFDGKEACYLALLERIFQHVADRVAAILRDAPDDEAEVTRALIAAFAHALVDDPRVAKASFGESTGISPTVDRQRRANRTWAAGFLESVWLRYGVTEAAGGVHHVAVGVIGGLFDLMADWLDHADPARPSDVDALIDDLTGFYGVVRAGLDSSLPSTVG